jgi:P-type Ca2+ transporter type 2C
LQRAFETTALQGRDWLTCVLVASSVVWLRELSKAALRLGRALSAGGAKGGDREAA